MRFVYLAQPIDQLGAGTRVAVAHSVAAVKAALVSAAVGWFDPAAAWSVPEGMEVGREIRQVDLWAQARCDAVVAILPDHTSTAGVPIEIERAATQYDQPTAVISFTERWAIPGNDRRRYFDPGAENAAVRWLVAQPTADRRRPLEPFRFRQLAPEGKLPTKVYGDDAGFDLYASQPAVVPVGEFRDIPCGIAMQTPYQTWALITGRSSTLRRRGLLVYQGVIDPGYRGELFVAVQNIGRNSQTIEVGERIGQVLLFNNTSMQVGDPRWVDQLDPHERGTNGFGSSGA